MLPAERAEIHPGVTQALRALEFRALGDGRDWRAVQCHSVGWKGHDAAAHGALRASFGPHGAAEIPLSPVLAGHPAGRCLPPPSASVRCSDAGGRAVSQPRSVRDEMSFSSASTEPAAAFLRCARRGAARHPR